MKKWLVVLACLLLTFTALAEQPASTVYTEMDYSALISDPEAHRVEKYELSGTVYRAQKAQISISNWNNPHEMLLTCSNTPDQLIWVVGDCPTDRDTIREGDVVHFIGSFQTATEIKTASGEEALIPFFVAGTLEIIN